MKMTMQEKMLKEIAARHFDPEDYSIIKLSATDEGHSNQYALCTKFGARVLFNICNKTNNIFDTNDLDSTMANHFFLGNWIAFMKEVEERE